MADWNDFPRAETNPFERPRSTPPPGFVIDRPAANNLPPGFVVDPPPTKWPGRLESEGQKWPGTPVTGNPFEDLVPPPHDEWADFRVGAPPPHDEWADFRLGPSSSPNVVSDVAKSAGIGLAKGAIGIPGAAGDVSSLVSTLARRFGEAHPEYQKYIDAAKQATATNPLSVIGDYAPSSADIQHWIERNVTGQWYEPQTTPGKYAESIASYAPALAGGAGSIGARLLRTAAAGVASEAAGEATAGTEWEPYARLAAGAVGLGAGHAIGETMAPAGEAVRPPGPPPPRFTPDMRAMERDITGAEPPLDFVPTQRNGSEVWLLPPETPHDWRGSVGAAATNVDPLAGYSPDTIDLARQVVGEAGVNVHDIDALSPHHFMAEINPAMEQEAARLYAADRGQARNTIWQSIQQRAGELRDRFRAIFDRNVTPAQNVADWRRAQEARRESQSREAWHAFGALDIRPTAEMRTLIDRMKPTGALKAADDAMTMEGGIPEAGMFRAYTEGAPGARPAAIGWQLAKEHLDHLIAREMAEGGDMNQLRRLTKLKNDLVGAIDNHPDENVRGTWAEARRLWQEPSELLTAERMGRNLLTRNIQADDIENLTQGWSPARMDAMRLGLRAYLEDVLQNRAKDTPVVSKVRESILAPGNQDKLRFILGEREADALIEAVRHEEGMHGAYNRIIGGSPTAGRAAGMARYLPQPGGIGETLSRVGDYLRHPLRTAAREGVEAVQGHVTAAEEARMARVRDEFARMLTTQGTERDATLRALLGVEEPPASTWSPTGGRPGAPPSSPPPAAPAAATGPSAGPRGPAAPPPASPPPEGAPGAPRLPQYGSLADETRRDAAFISLARQGYVARIQTMAMQGKSDAQIAATTGLDIGQVTSVRHRLGVAEGQRPPEVPPPPAPEMSAIREAARAHLREIRDLLQRLDGESPGVPPMDDSHTRRAVELTRDGSTPQQALEQSTIERDHAGQNQGLPPIPRGAGRVPLDTDTAPPHGVEAGAGEGQLRGGLSREAPSVSRGSDSAEAERRNGPDQGAVEAQTRPLRPLERAAAELQSADTQAFLTASKRAGAEITPEERAIRQRYAENDMAALEKNAALRREAEAERQRQAEAEAPKRALDLARRRGILDQIEALARAGRSDSEIAKATGYRMRLVDIANIRDHFGLPAGQGSAAGLRVPGRLTPEELEAMQRATRGLVNPQEAIATELNRISKESPEGGAGPVSEPLMRGYWRKGGQGWRDIERLSEQGKSDQEIAKQLGITLHAVDAIMRMSAGGLRPGAYERIPAATRDTAWMNQAVVDRLRDLHGQGQTFDQIAKELTTPTAEVTRDMVAGKLKRLGLLGEDRRLPQEAVDRIRTMRRQGKTPAEIAAALKVSRSAVASRFTEEHRDPSVRRLNLPPDEPIALTPQELAAMRKAGLPYKRGGRIPGELPVSEKHSHEEVGYVAKSPRSKQRCELCTKFIPAVEGGPDCKKVVQPIAPGAWCRRFVRREGV